MTEELSLQLTLYPAPVLRKRAVPVEVFDSGLSDFVTAMFECMRASGGVGLAAPQVGDPRRVLVLNAGGEEDEDLALVNAVIVDRSGPNTVFEEGCLSFPGIYAEVERPERCRVEYQDLAGERHEQDFDGFTGRVIQHEYDHLEGVLLVDRMSPASKLSHKAALAELVEDYRAEHGEPKKRRRR